MVISSAFWLKNRVKVLLLGAVVLCLGATIFVFLRTNVESNQGEKEFLKIIAVRPAPKLEDLAARSAPGALSEVSNDALLDILKLRETRDWRAVPVLERILAEHFPLTDSYGFAAAQALFCIDTPEAHAILSRYLLSVQYHVELGIKYAFGWDMPEPDRSSFILRYHLQNLSHDLRLTLSPKAIKDPDPGQLAFTLKMQNISDKPYRMIDPKADRSCRLFFCSREGRFFKVTSTFACGPRWREEWVQLAPGASYEFDMPVRVTRVYPRKHFLAGLFERGRVELEAGDFSYEVEKPGRFYAFAMVETRGMIASPFPQFPFAALWRTRRAVSRPVPVSIKNP